MATVSDFNAKVIRFIEAREAGHDPTEISSQLSRIDANVLDAMSDDARNLLAAEFALEAVLSMGRRRTGHKIVGAKDISNAARRIGARIARGTGEFSDLAESDRQVMIVGCPWCRRSR